MSAVQGDPHTPPSATSPSYATSEVSEDPQDTSAEMFGQNEVRQYRIMFAFVMLQLILDLKTKLGYPIDKPLREIVIFCDDTTSTVMLSYTREYIGRKAHAAKVTLVDCKPGFAYKYISRLEEINANRQTGDHHHADGGAAYDKEVREAIGPLRDFPGCGWAGDAAIERYLGDTEHQWEAHRFGDNLILLDTKEYHDGLEHDADLKTVHVATSTTVEEQETLDAYAVQKARQAEEEDELYGLVIEETRAKNPEHVAFVTLRALGIPSTGLIATKEKDEAQVSATISGRFWKRSGEPIQEEERRSKRSREIIDRAQSRREREKIPEDKLVCVHVIVPDEEFKADVQAEENAILSEVNATKLTVTTSDEELHKKSPDWAFKDAFDDESEDGFLPRIALY